MSHIEIVRERILEQATRQKPFDKSSYILNVVERLETGLVKDQPDRYARRRPGTYPSTYGEKEGFRRLVRSTDFVFEGMHWRMGDTELHLREANQPNNLQSLVVVCTGIEALERPSEGTVVLSSSPEIAAVGVHENKVISTMLLAYERGVSVETWCPDSSLTLGSRPQAHTKGHFESIIVRSLTGSGRDMDEVIDKLWKMYSLVRRYC